MAGCSSGSRNVARLVCVQFPAAIFEDELRHVKRTSTRRDDEIIRVPPERWRRLQRLKYLNKVISLGGDCVRASLDIRRCEVLAADGDAESQTI